MLYRLRRDTRLVYIASHCTACVPQYILFLKVYTHLIGCSGKMKYSVVTQPQTSCLIVPSAFYDRVPVSTTVGLMLPWRNPWLEREGWTCVVEGST